MSTSSHPLSTSIPAAAATPVPLQDPAVSGEVYAEVARLGLADHFPAAIALTREIFGDFAIDISVDPEIYDCSYVTFKVRSSGTLDEVLKKESEWFRQVRWPTQAPGSFCIDVDFN